MHRVLLMHCPVCRLGQKQWLAHESIGYCIGIAIWGGLGNEEDVNRFMQNHLRLCLQV